MMKAKNISIWFMALSIIFSALIVGTATLAQSGHSSFVPEQHFPVSDDKPHPALAPTIEALPVPLVKLEQAVQRAFEFDRLIATWDDGWTAEEVEEGASILLGRQSLDLWPKGEFIQIDRFKVGLFNSRTQADHAISSESAWYAPEVEAEAGEVWVIAIKGNVTARFPGGPDSENILFDGMVYQISSRTGNLLSIETGLPLTDERGKPILRDQQGNVLDEAGNIIWAAQDQ